MVTCGWTRAEFDDFEAGWMKGGETTTSSHPLVQLDGTSGIADEASRSPPCQHLPPS